MTDNETTILDPGTILYPLVNDYPDFSRPMVVVDGEDDVPVVDGSLMDCCRLFVTVRMPDGEEYALLPEHR